MDHVMSLHCMICARDYGPGEVAYTCPDCGPEGILDQILLLEAGQGDDLHLGPSIANDAGGFGPAQLGHNQVHQDNVRPELLHPGDGVVAVLRFADHLDVVLVEEIHALAGNKRGVHLALSLERLCRLTRDEPQRIGLSATVRPSHPPRTG